MGQLNGQLALVTGASRGLGKAIALALAEAGADVVINYRSRIEQAQEVYTKLQKTGRRTLAVQADVSKAEEVDSMFAIIRRKLGNPSIVVNNAGIARQQSLDQITEHDWNEIIANNLTSVFLVTQAALLPMRIAKFGRIINLSSVAAQLGGVVGPHYAASKAGIIGLTHSYAHLLANEGITVNAIAPALVKSDMVTNNPKATVDVIPVGRFGEPEEVASVAVMLASNGYITGQTVNVNGGWWMI